jgi:hypothetical protein
MNADVAVFSSVSITPQTIEELARTLPLSRHTIYKSVERLARTNLLSRQRLGKKVLLSVARGYHTAKLQEICIKALSRGVDPARLLSQSKRIARIADIDVLTARQVQKRTRLSLPATHRFMKSLETFGFAEVESMKPLAIRMLKSNELLKALLAIERRDEKEFPLELEERPYLRSELPPEELERRLFTNMVARVPFAIEGTSFATRGQGKIELLTPTRNETTEEKFMRLLLTPEGVEDTCIHMLRANQVNYEQLLQLARKRRMVNVVGCYLDILHGIDKRLVPKSVVELFKLHTSGRRHGVFLKQLKPIGKDDSLTRYAVDWGLDLYLDLDGIAHGVRST